MNEAPDMKELAAILQSEFSAADNYRGILARMEEYAQQCYDADVITMPHREGGSSIILPDVQEVIDYMLPSVVRTFVSGDRTVEFEATNEEDEAAADEATAVINWIFMRQQDGYRTLQDGCHDGLLRKTGIFKTAIETTEKITRETLTGDALQLGMLPEDVEVEAITENDDGTVQVEIKQRKIVKRFVHYAVPTSEFRFSPKARHEEDADYLCHVCEKTRSDLVEMGFDQEQVYSLPGHSYLPTIEQSRDIYRTEESSKAQEMVLFCEEYTRIDVDGDGIAERVKTHRVENEILKLAETGEYSIEVVEDQPFAIFCPFPRPHRLVGWSLADKVIDIQVARSFIARQMFDGMALSNMPRTVVDSGMADATTYSDILNPIPGSPIRIKGGASSLQALPVGFDIGGSMAAMEWLTGERESRTGITRLNQGLDADALNKTATGTAMMQAQGQQQEEYIARNLAEALSRMFMKTYRLMRAEGEPIRVKVDGQYKDVDPSSWPEEMNMIVRVGLGTNSKDKRIQGRMILAQLMAEGTAIGDVTPKHRFKAIDDLVRDMGIGQGDDYWTDPDAPPEIDPATGQPKQPEEKPDPEMMKVQAEQQMQQAKLDGEQQLSQARLASEHDLAQTRLQLMQAEGAEKQQLARDQANHDADLAVAKAQRESDLAEAKMAMEQRLAEQRMVLEAQMAEHKAGLAERAISTNKPGGRLDA